MDTVRCRHCGCYNRIPDGAHGSPVCGNCRRSLPWITEADDSDFAVIADRAAIPVIVDMWAPCCERCPKMTPALEQLAEERPGMIKLVKVDVERAPALTRRYAVQAVPTLLILDQGVVIAARSGAAPFVTLRDWVGEALSQRAMPAPTPITSRASRSRRTRSTEKWRRGGSPGLSVSARWS